MIREILLVHHTHTDIGYTHPQPAVFELHHRFIEAALNLADATAADSDDSRFRWTCEVTGTTRAWWEQASSYDQSRFLAAAARGQMEVAGMEWHMTPLADLRMLLKGLENVQFFRSLGVRVRSAMNTDVNGVPWGVVDVLLDHGIDGFSMAINAHMGDAVHPRPGAFKWAGPSGREITVWNGFQYWHAANVLLHMPSSVEAVSGALPPFLAEAERRGYPLSYLPLQITNPHHPDNAGPDPTIAQFVQEWNDQKGEVRIRTVLLSEVFDLLRKEDLPTLSGDWTDYWNFGAGSSTRETTVLAEGLRTLDAAHEVRVWSFGSLPREQEHLDKAHESLALYAEHTWGADCSISSPDSLETHLQWSKKSSFVYEGLAHSRIVLRDGLHSLAELAGGAEPTFLLYNPLSVPVKVPMHLPVEGLEWPLTPGVHHRQRLDGALGNIRVEHRRWCDIELPAFGYRTYPVTALPFSTSEGLFEEEDRIGSSRVALSFDIVAGGVTSFQVDGVEYAGALTGFTFGLPIMERPRGRDRREIMKLDFSKFDPAEGWHDGWPRDTFTGTLRASASSREPGAAIHWQSFKMENGDLVAVTYRLFANDPSLEISVRLKSQGDASPYSLALPLTLPESGETKWHFDTAGALVEFDKEQLPNACRHYVTARKFVKMQTESASLAVATPDLPLWKFGGMFFERSSALDLSLYQPVTLAWFSNNYWEVNFVADQTGETNYKMQLLPGPITDASSSYQRALPYTVSPRLHGYREMGPMRSTQGQLLRIDGDVVVDAMSRRGEDVFFTVSNLGKKSIDIRVVPELLSWRESWAAGLDGKTRRQFDSNLRVRARESIGIVLKNVSAPIA